MSGKEFSLVNSGSVAIRTEVRSAWLGFMLSAYRFINVQPLGLCQTAQRSACHKKYWCELGGL